jgi:predicted PurR-regulated permease PerM
MYGNYFHYVSSSGRLTAAAVLLLLVLCGFQVLSKDTIYRSISGCNTVITVQKTKDVRTKKTLQRLTTGKAAKCAISKSGKSQFC